MSSELLFLRSFLNGGLHKYTKKYGNFNFKKKCPLVQVTHKVDYECNVPAIGAHPTTVRAYRGADAEFYIE